MNFPKHKCGLYLTHNAHRDYYENISDYISDLGVSAPFKDDEAKARAVATDQIWELQWYPGTPVGFHMVAAPTLEEVLALALEVEAQAARLP